MVIFLCIVAFLSLFFTSSHPFMRACYFISILLNNKYEVKNNGKYILISSGKKCCNAFFIITDETKKHFVNAYCHKDIDEFFKILEYYSHLGYYYHCMLWVNEMGSKLNWYDQHRLTYCWLKYAKKEKIKQDDMLMKIQVEKIKSKIEE